MANIAASLELRLDSKSNYNDDIMMKTGITGVKVMSTSLFFMDQQYPFSYDAYSFFFSLEQYSYWYSYSYSNYGSYSADMDFHSHYYSTAPLRPLPSSTPTLPSTNETIKPSSQPLPHPSLQPTPQPVSRPTSEPISDSTPQPTIQPIPQPMSEPVTFAINIELTASSNLAQSQFENMKEATLTALNSGPQGPIYNHNSLTQFIYESQGM